MIQKNAIFLRTTSSGIVSRSLIFTLWPGLDIVRDPFHEVGGVLVLHI